MNKDYLIKVLANWKSRIESIDPETKEDLYLKARSRNGWFTDNFIDLAFSGLYNLLDTEKLNKWLEQSKFEKNPKAIRNIGIVMAGNIPMVGFHDLLCVMVSGHVALVKLSSQDNILIPYLIDLLYEIEPEFKSKVKLVERLQDHEAVIATGSNNSARYFNYYFRNIPHIIRKNRTSVGILNGKENDESLFALGNDMLNYFGLGCRSVSKLFVPEGYNFEGFFNAIQPLSTVSETNKYVNNYDYNKSIFLVNAEDFLDNGFLMMKKSDQLVSPVSVVFYESYDSTKQLARVIETHDDSIQCIASDKSWYEKSLAFGESQFPDPWEYADNINTLEFLGKV